MYLLFYQHQQYLLLFLLTASPLEIRIFYKILFILYNCYDNKAKDCDGESNPRESLQRVGVGWEPIASIRDEDHFRVACRNSVRFDVCPASRDAYCLIREKVVYPFPFGNGLFFFDKQFLGDRTWNFTKRYRQI